MEKLTWKEKRLRWKETKKAKRQEQKEYYSYAPLIVKVWNLYIKKPVCWILALCVLAVAIVGHGKDALTNAFQSGVFSVYDVIKNQDLSEKDKAKVFEMSPIDEEGSARIDAYPALSADETWTFYVYMVGSDLEDQEESDLSEVILKQTEAISEDNKEKTDEERLALLERFDDELADEGLELPAFFYYPVKPVESSEVVKEEVKVAKDTGAASKDISEITSNTWSDNIRFVIQPGGARSWSNRMINPNRTQRFLYEKGQFTEIANMPLKSTADPDTLADFLKFCGSNYRSDHNVLILWDHGGGPSGYGVDRIFGKLMTLKDMGAAFKKAYGSNPRKAPFDIIGFDACLMSTIEATHTLRGYADYYCVSEETEPGDGWNYTRFLQEMTDNPTMNVPQVGRAITDSYIDYYMQQNINSGFIITWLTTFAVLDAKKAEELYDAYSELCRAQLIDATTDLGVLAEIGRCGTKCTRYAGEYSKTYNMVDLGNYADLMSEYYPDECAKISKLVKETVLYHRESGSLSDSTGIAVYLPCEVDEFRGLSFYLDYIYNVCEDDNTKALYYYKQAGCLNEELSTYVENLTDNTPKKLDVGLFSEFTKAQPVIEGNSFTIPVNSEVGNLMVSPQIGIAKLDEKNNQIIGYGSNGGVYLDSEQRLVSDFDGRWPTINGVPMYVEIMSETESTIEYRAHVRYNFEEAYLLLSYDKEKDNLEITGVRKVSDDPNYLSSARTEQGVEPGAIIAPIYEMTNLKDNSEDTKDGKLITLKKKTKVEMKTLPKGYYLGNAVIKDPRGDEYYSAVVGADIDSKGVDTWKIDDRFYSQG